MSAPNVAEMVDVRAFGAAGDGRRLDTKAIQTGIDRCASRGGGTLCFPNGRYLTGTIILRSSVTLHLGSGAVLLGSPDIGDYDESVPGFLDGTGVRRGDALVCATGERDVAIEGDGVIDGQGAGFEGRRPMLLRFIECAGVRVRGVTLKDAAAWVHHYLRCDDVAIHSVTVRSRCNKNNDGLDLDGCERVRVSDCHFWSGDDALTLKSTTDRPCRDVVISNCLLSSECNGLKFGTESIGGFENVVISNCAIYDTRLCGLTIATVDGGLLQDVIVQGLTMRNVGAAFFIRRGSRWFHEGDKAGARPAGVLRNVTVRGLKARGVDRVGSSILGLPGLPVEDVVIDDVSIVSQGGGTREDAEREITEEPARYPQYEQWGVLPAYGLYCRHVRGLRIRDFRCDLANEDARPGMVCEDVEDLRVEGLSCPSGSGPGTEAVIRGGRA